MSLQTVSTTLSSANQTAVPSLVRRLLKIQAGDKLIWQVEMEKKTVRISPIPSKWGGYMRGLGKQIWSGTEATKYVNKLRQDRNI